MCRLALITNRQFDWLPYLRRSEKLRGGDGNGLYVGGVLIKGLHFKVEQAWRIILEIPGPALFHTRLASSGMKVCDELCHPFWVGDGALVHNGTWPEGAQEARRLEAETGEPWSDTRYFATLATELGFAEACRKWQPNGVLIFLARDGRFEVFKRGGELHYSRSLQSLGSERLPEDYPVADGFWDGTGEPPRECGS